MQRRLLLLACALLMSVGSVYVNAQTKTSSTASQQQYVEGVVRVKLQPEVASRMVEAKLPMSVKGTSKQYVQTGVTPLDRVNQKVKAVSMKRVFPYAGKYEAKHKAYGLDLWYDVRYEASDMKPAQVSNLYAAVQGVQKSQRVPVYKPIGGEKFIEVSPAAVAKAAKAASTMPFNDPLLKDQWHYQNDGSINGTKAGADANIFKAWATGVTGSKDVVVAIIDGGFQIDHPDLKDNLWINEAELNGQPGVDDDGDGYVDDIYGYNFVTNSSDISAHEHGTHVAGTVGATNGNGIGVCGVAGGSDGTGGVKMMVCQVFDSRTSTGDGDFAGALVYAADHGASIAQCSWGAASADVYDEAINEAVSYFTKNGGGEKMNGGLCIFASGNNGEEGNYYPGCLDDVVAVGALAADGSVAYYSNYGTWVDVTAPGGLEDSGQQYGVLSTLPNSTYGYNEGTSMACPHVSGIAALILSKYGSKDFSNETLRTLLTSSVNDLYTQNPTYEGKMGSGYIDAYKALQGKEGSTPEAVADFTVTPSHDNALIEWTIPDCEEKSIDHHVIYYSTTQFDASTDVKELNRVSVDTKFKTSGDKMSYELDGLKATTTYYFAIVAYSRWGKASEMSPVKSATTNAGPKVGLDKTTLSMAVDATKSNTASASFNIKNEGEGVLKYQLTTATTSATMSTSSRQTAPSPGQVVPFSGTMRSEAVKSNAVATSDYQAADWPDTLKYWSYVRSYIGDTDTKVPNAMAQYFYVDPSTYPNGFNLTALRFEGQNGENPELAIYDGARSISAASLLEKVTYSFWAYNWDISLPEQIYFAPGSSFWVVAKFPAGAKNPLAAAYTATSGLSPYSFYSNDNGNSWTQLSQVLKGTSWESVSDHLTWGVTALSKNPDWTSVLNPSPASGEVRAGESQEVTVSNDGQKLVNGTYKFNIHVKGNEATDSKKKVALTMTVKGNKPELHTQQLIDFGSLLVGQSKSIDVELTNSGYGVFGGSYSGKVTSSSNQFTVPSYLSAVSARAKGKVTITFKPTQAGDVTSTITVKDKQVSHTFLVRGVASEPAKLSLPTTEYNVGDLKVGGDEVTKTVTIKNDGKYPLQYVFPKFSSESIEGSTATVHKFGYTLQSNVAGDNTFDYEEAPVLADETDITSQFNSNVWQSGPVKVGFKFPFYGKDYDQIYVSSYGGVSMNAVSGRISCMVPTADCVNGLGYISAYTNSGWMEMGGNTKISYGHKDGKLYIKFKDVVTPATDGGGETTTISFHMALCPDGSVEVHYDNYIPDNVFGQGGNNFVGISDIACDDPCVFTDATKITEANGGLNAPYYDIETGSAIKIVAPAKSMIKSLSSTDGYVGNGESKDITVTLAAGDDLNAGELTNYLTVLTNDPVNSSANIKFTANITGDNLKPEAAYDSTSVDYGKVFRTSTQTRTVLLSNNGKDVLSVTSVAAKDDKFTVADDVKEGFTVPAGQGKDIIVTLPTTESGTVSDVLVITYADGTTKEIALKGEVIGCPTWSVDPAEISETTAYGENVQKTLTVTNNGDEKLAFSLTPDTWYKAGDVVADENGKVEYVFKSKSDGFDVDYDWKDITEDYTEHMSYAYFADKTDYKEVTLPFEFPFYGKKYKTMYIYDTGFVSFTKPEEDYKEFPEPPATLPSTGTLYSNMICPFWGNHTMNTPSTDGVYYKEGDDEVVVSFKNYGNTMMTGMNFQLIMRKDGSFKFQYKLNPDGYQLGVFGLCGIMDETKTRGICPADMYINSGNAIEFTPYKDYELAANGTVSIPVEIKADKLADDYSYTLNVTTNDPQHESVAIPVALTVTGEADAVFPETLNIEVPADPEAMEPTYYEFSVVNKGTKAFTITDISSPMFEATEGEDWWDVTPAEAELQVYMPQSNGGGDIGGDDGGVVGLASDSGTKIWQSYYTGYMDPITVGQDTLKFRLMLTNNYDPHEGEYDITFNVEGLDSETKTTHVNLNITDLPVLAFDEEDTFYMDGVANEGKHTFTTNMKNEGEYKLTYSLRLDASGRDEQTSSDYDDGGIAPAYNVVVKPAKAAAKTFLESSASQLNFKTAMKAMGVKKVKDEQQYVYDVPRDFDYTNLLYHPILNPISSAKAAIMGSGSNLDENYYAATRYEAPAEGFNLSHLYFVGTVGTLENVDIEASVILGNDVTATDKTIGHGKLHVDKEEASDDAGNHYGVVRMLEFDKPVYINPADTFYVVLKYPAGYATSAVMTSKDGEMETNRYMCHLNSLGGWVDIEALYDDYYSYGAFGFCMTCVETQKGESWIKLLNSDTEGEIAVGETKELQFEVNPESTYFERENKATLVVKSNDPTKKVYNYHLVYSKNSAPYITVPDGTLTVPEAGKATATVSIEEVDGEAFTVSIDDASGIGSVAGYTNGDGTQEGISYADGVISVEAGQSLILNVELAPGYEKAGAYSFKVTATDSKNNVRTATVNYNVEHTNRAPEYTATLEEIVLNTGETSGVYYFNDLFTEPDGEEMSFTASMADNTAASLFTSGQGFVVTAGQQPGTASVLVSATDEQGLKTTKTILVTVKSPTGISGVTADGSNADVTVNADGGNAEVTFATAADKAVLMLYSNAGQLVAQKTISGVHAGDKVSLSAGHALSGVYHLVVDLDGKGSNLKFAVK